MIWNEETQSYRGKTSDGKIVDVTGDEWAESVADGIRAYAENNGDIENFDGDIESLRETNPSLYENYENLTWAELNDPDMWASLVGDNQNVEFVGE